MLTEERKTIVKTTKLPEYLAYCRSYIWPSIRTAGGQILCVVGEGNRNTLNTFSTNDTF